MKTFWLSFAAEENALGAMLVDAPAPHQAIALGREIFRRQHQDPDVEIACWEVGPPATREQRHIWALPRGHFLRFSDGKLYLESGQEIAVARLDGLSPQLRERIKRQAHREDA